MQISLWCVGKTSFDFVQEGLDEFEKRINHFVPFELKVIKNVSGSRNMSPAVIKRKEGELIAKDLKSEDYLILLDEKGAAMSSLKFADFIENKTRIGLKKIVFLIGGAYGFSPEIYAKAKKSISLSSMTFSHQLIRLIFAEQLYRACTINKGIPYHNE